MVLTILALIAVLATTAFWWFHRSSKAKTFQEFAKRNVKYVPQPNAFLQILRKQRIEETKHAMIQKKGKVWGFNFLKRPTICVAEPEIAQLVLSKEFTNFTNRRLIDTNDPFFRDNIFAANDENWKRMRAIITPTFSAGSLRRMKPLLNDTIQTLIKNFDNALQSSSLVNVKQMYGAYTMDTVIQIAFGTKVDSLVEKDNPIIGHAKQLISVDMSLKNTIKFTLLFMAPKLAKLLKIRFNPEVVDYFTEFVHQVIKQRQQLGKERVGKPSCFLELLLEAKEEEEKLRQGLNGVTNETVNGHANGTAESGKCPIDHSSNGSTANGHTNGVVENGSAQNGIGNKITKFMTDEELIAQAALFIIAGYDTTATSIVMASYLLTTHPEVQEKLYQENNKVIAKLAEEAGPDAPTDPVELVTVESLSRFEYLNAVVNETLRLYAPATFVERQVTKNMTLETEDGRVKIYSKTGDVLHFPVYSMHRDADQFPEPEEFKPERFLGQPTFHKYAYMPFGNGPRNCVARSLALLEAKLALLHTVRLFKFSVAKETKIPPEFFYQSQAVIPKDIILKVERR